YSTRQFEVVAGAEVALRTHKQSEGRRKPKGSRRGEAALVLGDTAVVSAIGLLFGAAEGPFPSHCRRGEEEEDVVAVEVWPAGVVAAAIEEEKGSDDKQHNREGVESGPLTAIAEGWPAAGAGEQKAGDGEGCSYSCNSPQRRGEQGLRSNGHILESSGGAKISGGEDGGGAAALVLLLDDEATVDDGTGGLREGGLEVEGNHTHPLSEEGEHGDIREVVADMEADDRRGIGKGAKSGEARGGDAVGLRSLSRSDKTVIGQWKEKKE
ncbi:hypothetical protein GW17_00060540, partial [Ensete ventricosum]